MDFIKHIKYLEHLIIVNNQKTLDLKKELQSVKLSFQENCTHEFKMESDNDYHSARYYNTCSLCNLIKNR